MTIPIKEVQNKILEILLYFDGFCKENNLKYYLCGGCLIGVVRHQGFVPWDDDVDVFMPREDYERLARLWNERADVSKYLYCRTNRKEQYHDGGASIRDVNTTMILRHSIDEDICHGMGIEIMPIDACPKSTIKRIHQLYNAFLFGLFNVQRLPDNKGKFFRVVASLVYKIIQSPERRYKIWKKAEHKMSKYDWKTTDQVTELIGSIKGMLLRHPKADFENVEYKEFEGHLFPVMAGYERYLTKIWGDYMQLPPVEKRVPKQDAVFVSTREPYKQYKGIYYCLKEDVNA